MSNEPNDTSSELITQLAKSKRRSLLIDTLSSSIDLPTLELGLALMRFARKAHRKVSESSGSSRQPPLRINTDTDYVRPAYEPVTYSGVPNIQSSVPPTPASVCPEREVLLQQVNPEWSRKEIRPSRCCSPDPAVSSFYGTGNSAPSSPGLFTRRRDLSRPRLYSSGKAYKVECVSPQSSVFSSNANSDTTEGSSRVPSPDGRHDMVFHPESRASPRASLYNQPIVGFPPPGWNLSKLGTSKSDDDDSGSDDLPEKHTRR